MRSMTRSSARSIAKKAGALPLLFVAGFSVAAESRGCTAQTTDDGTSHAWETATVPTPSTEVQPMTCEWLESDNCWKQVVRRAVEVGADAARDGELVEERNACTYDAGGRFELGGAISPPDPGQVLFPITNWRLVDAEGDARVTGKILAIGRHVLDVDGDVVLFENLSLTEYHVTCPDGTTYGNDVEGTCEDWGAKWLAQETPGTLLVCDGDVSTCKAELWGGDTGRTELTRCTYE